MIRLKLLILILAGKIHRQKIPAGSVDICAVTRMLRNSKTMKTGKRPPLKDIRQNRGTPTKGSKLVRKYQRRMYASSKFRSWNHHSFSLPKDALPQPWRLQPYVRLTRVDDIISSAKIEEKVAPAEVETPVEQHLAVARCVISSLMMYPNMLGHEDFQSLRGLLLNLGVKYTWDTVELQVPLEVMQSEIN